MSALRENDRVSNYILEQRRGVGSFGEVWRARHHVLGDIVAIKIPTDAQYVRNLQREGVTVHGLNHRNIVRVLDLDPYATPPYLVMEYVDGPSVREVIDARRADFPIDAAVTIMRGVLSALTEAHRRDVIHRDIKPANILLDHPLAQLEGVAEEDVKVVDFGLGSVGNVTTRSITQSGSVASEDAARIAGTLAYMSPEQREGKPVDARSDLYSCGIVLFEMLTGERPAGGEVPGSLRADVPPYLDEVFRRCYARRDRRYASAGEMLAALEPAPAARPVGPPPPPPRGPMPMPQYGTEPRCRHCHEPIAADDNFCIHCGARLVESVPVCRHCGAYARKRDRFCIRCGKSLTVLM